MFLRACFLAHRFVNLVVFNDHQRILVHRLLPGARCHGLLTRKSLEGLNHFRPSSNLQGSCRWYYGEQRDNNGCNTGCLGRVTLSHPWPEWSELMKMLLQKGYLDSRVLARPSFPPPSAPSVPLGYDSKGSNHVRTACLNFARDRDGLIRHLSIRDVDVVVRSGCPSIDRKSVNSGKRLRAFVGIDERDACTSCRLRGRCERAYVRLQEGESGRTVDLIRILLTYALDMVIGSADSQLSQDKILTRSIRKLLNEVHIFSAKEREIESSSNEKVSETDLTVSPNFSKKQTNPLKQGGWTCPICNFINSAEDIKCLHCKNISDEKLREQKEKHEHLPLKRGDWICNKCNFLNFAKNTRCLQCNEKATGRQFDPGEWECPSCGYINFRRNMVCLKCVWRRPRSFLSSSSFSEGPSSDKFQLVDQEFHGYLEKKCFKTGSETFKQHSTPELTSVNDRGFRSSAKDEIHSVEIDT